MPRQTVNEMGATLLPVFVRYSFYEYLDALGRNRGDGPCPRRRVHAGGRRAAAGAATVRRAAVAARGSGGRRRALAGASAPPPPTPRLLPHWTSWRRRAVAPPHLGGRSSTRRVKHGDVGWPPPRGERRGAHRRRWLDRRCSGHAPWLTARAQAAMAARRRQGGGFWGVWVWGGGAGESRGRDALCGERRGASVRCLCVVVCFVSCFSVAFSYFSSLGWHTLRLFVALCALCNTMTVHLLLVANHLIYLCAK